MASSHGLRFERTQFWVIHRRMEYGPFDYDWTLNLDGVELLYQGKKFGEICSREELFADLSEFRLPRSVVHVACVVIGCTALGIALGYTADEREEYLIRTLKKFDCERFLPALEE